MSSSPVMPVAPNDRRPVTPGARTPAEGELAQVRSDLGALDDLPTSDHAEVYARIHSSITSVLSTTAAPADSPPGF